MTIPPGRPRRWWRLVSMDGMSGSAEKPAREAMALPAPERAELAHRLIISLDEDAEASATADAAGQAEAVRRLGEIKRDARSLGKGGRNRAPMLSGPVSICNVPFSGW